jgi:hypothetical protein
MNRRSFIRRFGLITGGAFISLKAGAFVDFKYDKAIHGRVTSGRKGLAGAVISDGYSVVVTDAKGKYSIKPHVNARNIFISTPAGYEFKTSDHIATQYEKLGNRNQYDFALVPLKQDDSKHHFIIWADPQVKNKTDVAQMLDTSVPDVQQLVKSMGAGALVHGICVGDIVWDNHALFEDYNQAVAHMGIPFFQVLGNHDMDYRKGGDETSDQTFADNYGPTYYSFNRGKVHYVVLDDVRYLGKERDYDGYITPHQLDWLKKDLEQVPRENLLIVSVHIPVHNAVKNNTELYALLEPFTNVHIMSGHTHYNKNVVTNGIYEHNHGTVCGAWWSGPVCGDGTPNGYGVYKVNGTDLSWYYKATGSDKDYQVSLDIEDLTNQKRLLANVWNWDPQWKVEWWADDKAMGTLASITGYDPQSVRLYKGDKLPAKRSFAEPERTGHLFIAHFNPAIKKVKVVATDRFGNKYEQKVNV